MAVYPFVRAFWVRAQGTGKVLLGAHEIEQGKPGQLRSARWQELGAGSALPERQLQVCGERGQGFNGHEPGAVR